MGSQSRQRLWGGCLINGALLLSGSSLDYPNAGSFHLLLADTPGHPDLRVVDSISAPRMASSRGY